MVNTQSARLAPFFTPNVNLNLLVSFPQGYTCKLVLETPSCHSFGPARQPSSVAWQNWTDWKPWFEGSLQFWKGQERGSNGVWVWNWQCLLRTVNKYVSAELGQGLVISRVINGRPSKTGEVTADVADLRAQLVGPARLLANIQSSRGLLSKTWEHRPPAIQRKTLNTHARTLNAKRRNSWQHYWQKWGLLGRRILL